MLNKVIFYTTLCILISSCSILNKQNNYKKPIDLLFQNKKIDSIKIHVQRDDKLCKDETDNNQDCPIKLYVDDFKSGEFFTNNEAFYYLKPNEYILKAKNCTNECSKYELKIDLNNQLKYVTYVLSIDNESNPIIIQK